MYAMNVQINFRIPIPYQSASGKLEKQASNNGSQKLCNPIQDAPQQGYVPTKERTKSHCRVHMATGDVGANRYRHEKSERMSQRRCY